MSSQKAVRYSREIALHRTKGRERTRKGSSRTTTRGAPIKWNVRPFEFLSAVASCLNSRPSWLSFLLNLFCRWLSTRENTTAIILSSETSGKCSLNFLLTWRKNFLVGLMYDHHNHHHRQQQHQHHHHHPIHKRHTCIKSLIRHQLSISDVVNNTQSRW